MTIEQELELSYYQQVAEIDAEHSIYLVQDIRNKKFYVKKLLTVYNADIYRFLYEHPVANTPKLHLVIEDRNILTVIEEYLPGDTLDEILDQKGTLPEERALDIALQLCTILADFHKCNPAIVNRDIKPSNIKISPDGVVKLLDLNAAKWSNEHAAKDTVLLGTKGYAAPEQYGFGPSSVLTDIYSVGVLMNVMLCGELPNKQIAGGKLGKIARKCVELSPSSRYQSIHELIAALDQLAGRESIDTDRKTNWRKYLPPGFRTNNPVTWVFSILGYILFFYISLGLQVENAGFAEVLLNRITFTILGICIILFNGNYLDIHQKFVLTKSKQRWVRWVGMAIVDFALVALWVIILDFIVAGFIR